LSGLVPASSNEPYGCSLTPTPWWDGEENQKEKAKLVDWDKNSLIDSKRKKKITRRILMNMQSATFSLPNAQLTSE